MRALIIGYGSIGQRHARNLVALEPNAEVLILRRSPGEVDGATVVASVAEALAAEPTVAIIASPSASHVDVLPDLVASAIPTYVEKPVVTKQSHVEAVRAALAERPGVPHATGFNLRLLPSLSRARDLVREGRLGTIVRGSFSAGQWLPDWRRTADFRQSYSTRKDEGGGVIFDLSHELDAARFLLDDFEIKACATTRLDRLGIDSESAATILGQARSGSLVSVNVDYVARRPVRRYELVGDKATLIWDLPQRHLELHGPDGVEIVTERPDDFDVAATYVSALKSFLAAASGAEPAFLQSLEDGLRSTELAIAANQMDTSQ
ncbi:MAG: hypothetical protein ABS75_27585 [Pelagibacterium sp. SCN 63-23]|nr:MAG: hypothetical protein ABS75_27585 [Pelagibacterium sp. SCN 63-23]